MKKAKSKPTQDGARMSFPTRTISFMQILKAGDVRQEGDEVRRIVADYSNLIGPEDDYRYFQRDAWLPVRLLSHPILPADLIVSEFRRPQNCPICGNAPFYCNHSIDNNDAE